jgi:hypothetical protein
VLEPYLEKLQGLEATFQQEIKIKSDYNWPLDQILGRIIIFQKGTLVWEKIRI